eukprot:Polyplicarium_translucidae@DN2356_c0_g1_i2.p2
MVCKYWLAGAPAERYMGPYRMHPRLFGRGRACRVKMADRCSLTADGIHAEPRAIKCYASLQCRRTRVPTFTREGDVEMVSAMEKLHAEFELLGRLSHRNIVAADEMVDDDKHQITYVVMEAAPFETMRFDTSLREYRIPATSVADAEEPEWHERKTLIRYSECGARALFVQMLEALEYLRSCNVVHKDIKPDNVLLDRALPQSFVTMCPSATPPQVFRQRREVDTDEFLWEEAPFCDPLTELPREGRKLHEAPPGTQPCLKIVDFNTATEVESDGSIWDAEGTRCFTPPECLDPGQKGEGVDGYKRDMWSAGVMLYCWLCGKLPFWSDNSVELIGRIITDPLTFPEDVPLTDDARRFIGALLEKDPRHRLSAASALKHEWILHTVFAQYPNQTR